jgi:MSHA type pilus biogenesis protein MshL
MKSVGMAMSGMALVLGACTHTPMLTTDTHIRPEPEPAGNIPPPVQISTILPKPKATARPETYTVVVNNVRVQELLFALARDAKLNIDIHPGISGTVTLNAIDQTLPQLLARIAKQVDMRWELDGPNLVVMADSPYLRVYKVDYVNMDRATVATVGVSSQISSGTTAAGAGGGAGAAGLNASNTTVRSTATNKFWETLIDNVKDILRETDKIIPAGTAAATQSTAAAIAAAPASGAAPGAPAAIPQPPSVGVPSATFREAASVIANPEAGVLTIRATSRQHEKIQEFLDQVLVNAKRQVLIEATIAEVQLNNQYQQGIDWSLIRQGPAGFNVVQTSAGSPAGVSTNMFVLGYVASGITATIRLLESFGTVRVLSSPKLSVINNQTAILKVVDNRVYFTVQANQTATQTVVTTAFTTTPNVVPVGFVMNVTPQISDSDTVLLNVKPSVSRIISFVNDPNPSLASPCGPTPTAAAACQPIVSRIPEVQTREMESMMKVNSGQIAVLGGLIQDSISDVQDRVPLLAEVPIIGGFFTQRNKTNVKTELVVFLRPVVVKDPSIDGDYRSFRSSVPDENFIRRTNPGKQTPLGGPLSPP